MCYAAVMNQYYEVELLGEPFVPPPLHEPPFSEDEEKWWPLGQTSRRVIKMGDKTPKGNDF
ncbi:MAG: hypothetical protein QG614_120 [Patescibacteria group bacterium]|nr:hypothetical protein [Patescibacteria group bacterium]